MYPPYFEMFNLYSFEAIPSPASKVKYTAYAAVIRGLRERPANVKHQNVPSSMPLGKPELKESWLLRCSAAEYGCLTWKAYSPLTDLSCWEQYSPTQQKAKLWSNLSIVWDHFQQGYHQKFPSPKRRYKPESIYQLSVQLFSSPRCKEKWVKVVKLLVISSSWHFLHLLSLFHYTFSMTEDIWFLRFTSCSLSNIFLFLYYKYWQKI